MTTTDAANGGGEGNGEGRGAGEGNGEGRGAGEGGGDGAAKKFRFPTAYTILALVAVVVWALAFIVPTGEYGTDADGKPKAGSYHHIHHAYSFTDRLRDLLLSPVNGLYGIKDAKTGMVAPDNSGELYGSAAVFLFVLAIGAFITMTMATGALDSGIARLAHRLRHRGVALVVAVMIVFSVGGTTEGMAEETLGFYGLIIPLALALGYDRLVGASVIILGAGVGTLCSTINPFATGVASGAAGISIGDGLPLRLLMYLVLTAVVIAYVVRYAARVKRDPARSLVGFRDADREVAESAEAEPPALSGRHKAILVLVALTFVFMIYAILPWAEIVKGPDARPFSWELGWYFPELTALFVVATLVVGAVGGLGEAGTVDRLVSGAGDFLGAALIIVLARGVSVIMNNAKITDTVLHSLENLVTGSSTGVFAWLMFVVNLPLAFLIPSTSGHATLAIPILAPLADFAHVPRALVVTAWQSASGLINLFTPTTAVVMGGLALAKVGYDRYLRFVAPLLGLLFVLVSAVLAVAALI
ncbi:YfcC family protein [Actinomadura gamaensis]|uniref:YfcC family protein n=1 Tax=Actinomadura gamaensis TaxID=1763541 RepID=A0ABV9UCZ6_9ACTN